jgi:hypothetical protein
MPKESKTLNFITDPVLEPYYIQLDEYCYIAQKSTFSEKGNEYQNTIGHYTSLGNCLKAIARDSSNSKSYNSVKEYVKSFEQKLEEIKNIIKL